MVNNQEFSALMERVGRLEALMGSPPETSTQVGVFQRILHAEETLEGIRKSIEEIPSFVEGRMVSCEEEISAVTDAFDSKLEGLLDELRLVKRALRDADERPSAKVKVPEPKPFEGVRSSKELENFLWDMETYFTASHIPESEKVSITCMYLSGDAKLWWRTRQTDTGHAGWTRIETWDVLKKELKDQFLPCNSAWLARDAMRKLKHTGAVREYVKEFSSLMLHIKDMAEEDKLYNFLAGLQSWAQVELRRQGVRDLQSAIAAADGLVDYKDVEGPGSGEKGKDKDKGWKSKKKFSTDATGGASDSAGSTEGVRKKGCFICNGDHRMRECPKRERLNALVVENEETTGANPPRVNCMQLLSAVQVVEDGEEVQRELLDDAGMSLAFAQGREMGIGGGQCDAVLGDVSSPPTTRTSSSFGGGGLLDP